MTDPALDWVLIRLTSRTLWLPQRDAEELSVEVSSARPAAPTEPIWESGALVPSRDWSGIRWQGEPRVVTDVRFHQGRDVAVVKLGDEAIASAHERQLARLGAVEHSFPVGHDLPGATTVTVNRDRNRFLGLHLDNWDGLPASHRHMSRNRVSLNLGPETRWFLFVDVDVTDSLPPCEVPDTEQARHLVLDSPTPVVVGLRVPAGWAYIAPTDNLLHDACSLWQREGTSHVSALGRFTPTPDTAPYSAVSVDGDTSSRYAELEPEINCSSRSR